MASDRGKWLGGPEISIFLKSSKTLCVLAYMYVHMCLVHACIHEHFHTFLFINIFILFLNRSSSYWWCCDY